MAYQTAKSLTHKGLKVFVICNQDYSSAEAIASFNSSLSFPVFTFKSSAQPLLYLFKKFLEFRKICQRENPRVILTSGVTPTLISIFADWFQKTPRLTVVHGPEFQVMFKQKNTLANFVLNKTHVFTVSHYSKQYLINNGYKKDIHVINNSAQKHAVENPDTLSQLQKKYLGKKILLTVGRMYHRKGQEFVIRALPKIMENFPNVCYLLIGHEEKKEYLQKISRDLNVESHVDFVGQIPKNQLGYYQALCDVYILMSQNLSDGDFEGFGISIIEAAFHGKPAIGSKNCGIADAIIHNKTGLLLENSNPETIAEAVAELFSDPQKAKLLGENAKFRAENELTWEKYADKFISYMNNTLN